jgi:tRNA(Ile)-lysidine synthase
MLSDFLNYINDHNLITKGKKVLLAVSGGIDSMVMSDLFMKSGLETGIAHCNFSLRGIESDLDEELVKKRAIENNILFHTVKFQTGEFASEKGISVQMAARELRYEWFEKVRREYGYESVAVAHNLNDSIETMLINLTRGTGIAGLTGIKPSINHIIRPMLFATRSTIEKYQEKHKITYREDRSNSDVKYNRNRIRHLVIPVLKEINPSVENTLNETAERLSGINEIVNIFIEQLKKDLILTGKDYITLNISKLKPYLGNRTIIFEIFREFGVTNPELRDLVNIIEGRTGSEIFTLSHRIIRDREKLIITGKTIPEDSVFIVSGIKEMKKAPGIASANIDFVSGEYSVAHNRSTASLDYRKILFPLTIRHWHEGDSFFPFGMNKRKKLSDYFIDRKFSKPDKENALVVESDGKIIWIVGERIDNRFRITTKTKEVLVLKARGKK